MTTTSNIIAFPNLMQRQVPVPTPTTTPTGPVMQSVQPVNASPDTWTDTSTSIASLATTTPFDPETEAALHAVAIVGASIRFARRKGVSLDSLPKQLRLWLLRECERGEPACLVVRDWLTGNRKYLPDEIEASVGHIREGESA